MKRKPSEVVSVNVSEISELSEISEISVISVCISY